MFNTTKYYSGIAGETIHNNSVCVKEGDMIRNIESKEDIETSLLVFVCNVGDVYMIDPNRAVRYAIVNLTFR